VKRRVPLKRSGQLRRTGRLKTEGKRSKKSGGQLFPRRHDPVYRQWIRTQYCVVHGHVLTDAGSQQLRVFVSPDVRYWHGCEGPIEGCHVKSRGAGGSDRGNMVAMCWRAHQEQHCIGIKSFQARWSINLEMEALKLYVKYLSEVGS
jgi:hypothetical protein